MKNTIAQTILNFQECIEQQQADLNLKIQCFFDYLNGLVTSSEEKTASSDAKEQFMKYKNHQVSMRGDGRWYARARDEFDEWAYFYGKTQRECYDKLKTFVDNNKNKPKLPKPKKVAETKINTLKTFFPVWLDVYKIPYVKASTITNYSKIWKNWLTKTQLVDVELKKITSVDLQIFLSQIEYPIMRDKVKILLSDILNKARIHKLIESSPMIDVKIKKHKEQEGKGLTEEEESAFVEVAVNSNSWIIFALMLYEGLRPGEAKAMRHSDIKGSYISVSRAMNDVGEMTTTKTGKTRNIPIFPDFEQLANELRSDSDELLFPNVSKHTGNIEFLDIITSLKIDQVMYSLRHTFATRCAESDISPKQVQLWMGHSDIKTTLKYYTHISKKFERENVKKKSNLS